MTFSITKGQLIRWIIAAFFLICGPTQAIDVPRAAVSAVTNREFMADFTGYDDYSLLDVYEWKKGLIVTVMLCPVGFHETRVYDLRNGGRELIYRDAFIPSKKTREKMRKESVTVAEAIRLARKAIESESSGSEMRRL
jgi:hypothetical protein